MKHDHRSGPLDASALHLLHRAGQCAEVLFTNEAAKSDLTPRQFAVLVCVAQNPDVSQTGLVEQTGVDRSTLADVVRRLVKKGARPNRGRTNSAQCTRARISIMTASWNTVPTMPITVSTTCASHPRC